MYTHNNQVCKDIQVFLGDDIKVDNCQSYVRDL